MHSTFTSVYPSIVSWIKCYLDVETYCLLKDVRMKFWIKFAHVYISIHKYWQYVEYWL